MDLQAIKRRLKSGEGLTLEEAKDLVGILEGEKFDLIGELNAGFADSVRQLRNLVNNGGDSAKVAASKELIRMHNEQVITDDGQVTISFEAMDRSDEVVDAMPSSEPEPEAPNMEGEQ